MNFNFIKGARKIDLDCWLCAECGKKLEFIIIIGTASGTGIDDIKWLASCCHNQYAIEPVIGKYSLTRHQESDMTRPHF